MARRSSPARRAQRELAARVAQMPAAALARWGLEPEGGAALARLIAESVGKVVLPGDKDYDADRQESNPAFQAYPLAICYCAVEGDVLACLQLARSLKVPFVMRSGGHSTAGYSVVDNGIVIDMSLFDHVIVDTPTRTVRVGPGADFDTLNGALNSTGLHVPSGECGNVCVGGFVQGGGYGYTSRKYGIQSDSVLAFRVMLADGRIVVADAQHHELLHWALKGGTGGNFGVLLEVTYQLYPLPSVWAWAIQWSAADAPAVLVELQAHYMRHGAAPELGMTVNLGFHEGAQVMLAQGMWAGSRADGLAAVRSLMAFPSAQLLSDESGPYGAMDSYLDSNPYAIPDPPAGSKEDKRAGYIASTLTLAEWQAVVAYAATAPNPNNTMIIEPYGGYIATVPKLASAFIHRDVDMDLFVDVFWVDDKDMAAAKAWLDGFMALLKPHLNGHVYQNYPHAGLADFAHAYWGEALPRLKQAKQHYDPENLFRFPQSVPLP
jgi:FAD/FMN-containing dehydrogenase